MIKRHTILGAELLCEGRSQVMQVAPVIVRSHHEQWDGRGYPDRLAGDAIPMIGRIAALADFFDAVAMRRSYREPWPLERVLEELRERAGIQFDPRVVDAFFRCFSLRAASESSEMAGPSDPSSADSLRATGG
ncbi:hypothetical protein BH23GEM6_BH23GEM6_06170 [soil metagenome]